MIFTSPRVLGAGAVLAVLTALTACSSDGGSSGSSGSSDPSGGSSGSSSSRSVAAFCDAYDLDAVTKAASDPKGALEVLKKVKDVAPDAIRSDAEFVYNALKDATENKASGDVSKITNASASVAKYFAQECK